MAVHSILSPALSDVVEEVLRETGLTHVVHGERNPVAAAEAIVADAEARAIIGPLRSRAGGCAAAGVRQFARRIARRCRPT